MRQPSNGGPDIRPEFARGERTLLSTWDTARQPVIASDRGLYHRNGQWRRLGWEQIVRIGWDRDRGVLALGCPLPELAPGMTLWPAAGARLVPLVRDRVGAATLTDARIQLGAGTPAWLCARRRPGTGELLWILVPRTPADLDDPGVHERVCAAIREIRAHTGI